MRSELISERHLARRAVIYIRQSTPHQVLTNLESQRLQYDLRRRALELGWREEDIEVIDADLGLNARAIEHREGFKDLIARMTLGQIGIVLSYEVTRLSRNCTDWYPLLDLCSFKDCLIADRDGVYDPASDIPPLWWTPDTLYERCLPWPRQRFQTERSGMRLSFGGSS